MDTAVLGEGMAPHLGIDGNMSQMLLEKGVVKCVT